ncbi:MAG TPA: hypothetical protein VHQ24_06830 [Lachnospiraceae bacterium]|nr:hypothetical protein [Lachnospiraceae bacterium]
MNYKLLFKEQNDSIKERYELAMDRVKEITMESTVKEPFVDYFRRVAGFILDLKALADIVEVDSYESKSLEEMQEINRKLYKDIYSGNYESSYGNPAYAVKMLGEDYGRLLTCLYARLRACIPNAIEYRLFDLTINTELVHNVPLYYHSVL